MDRVKKELYKCLTEMGITSSQITDSAHYMKDLGFDSLDISDLILRVEDRFKIQIPDSDWQILDTVGNTEVYLSKNIHYQNQNNEVN